MKNSSKLWLSAALIASVALGYLLAVMFGTLASVDVLYDYLVLGLGLLATFPLWLTSFGQNRWPQSLVSLVALVMAYGVVVIEQNPANFWQPVAMTVMVSISGWLVVRQNRFVNSKRKQLSTLVPSKASVIDGMEIDHVTSSELEVGQVVLVRPGNAIPCDGYVIQGQSRVDQTEITGENDIRKGPGDWVLAGSLNIAGKAAESSALTIRVAAVRENLLVRVLDESQEFEHEVRVVTLSGLAGTEL